MSPARFLPVLVLVAVLAAVVLRLTRSEGGAAGDVAPSEQAGEQGRAMPVAEHELELAAERARVPPATSPERDESGEAVEEAEPRLDGPQSAPEQPTTSADELCIRLLGEEPTGVLALAVRGDAAFMGTMESSALLVGTRTKLLARRSDEVCEARFTGLAPGSWSAGVRLADGMELWQPAYLRGDEGRTVVFERGAVVVRGTVWDELGRPVEGAAIAIDCPAPGSPDSQRNASRRVRVATDAAGVFRATGLSPGAGWFVAEARGTELANHVLSLPADLGPGEELTVNVGSPGGVSLLRATFVDGVGDPVPSGSAEAFSAGAAGSANAQLNRNGVAELELAPGQWSIRLWASDGDHGVVGSVTLDGAPVTEQRFVLGGTRLSGTLRRSDGSAASDLARNQQVVLRDSPDGYIRSTARVASDGTFRFYGVEPGERWLTSWPAEAVAPVAVPVTASDVALEVDIALR